MKKTTKSVAETVYNGSVHVEVKAETAEKAIEIAKGIPGLTLSEGFDAVPMPEQGTFILSGNAKDVTGLPDGVTLWIKGEHQMT